MAGGISLNFSWGKEVLTDYVLHKLVTYACRKPGEGYYHSQPAPKQPKTLPMIIREPIKIPKRTSRE